MSARKSTAWRASLGWSVSGGLWGAWVGYQGALGLHQNADTFGSFLAQGYFIVLAVAGFLMGMALSVVVGSLVKKFLLLLGMPNPLAVLMATLIGAWVLWYVTALIQARYPGLRAPQTATPSTRPSSRPAISDVRRHGTRLPCSQCVQDWDWAPDPTSSMLCHGGTASSVWNACSTVPGSPAPDTTTFGMPEGA